MAKVFDADDWGSRFYELHDYQREAIKLWQTFNNRFIKRFEQYLVPVIELSAETPREAVCQVFEKVNTGGVTLTVFELLTAAYAAEEFDLRRDWEHCSENWSDSSYRVLWEVSETDFLQAMTLLATYRDGGPRIGCRRSDILKLPLDDYKQYSKEIVDGLLSAARFLHHRNIFDVKFIPYETQLIPLAAICTVLGTSWNSYEVQHKVARWYRSGVYGELYGGATETRFARDLPEVVNWVLGHTQTEPRTVSEAHFAPDRLIQLRTRNSAAYKGVYALLLENGARDWCSGNAINTASYFDEAIDIHHVFPHSWCTKNEKAREYYDSIINKTPLPSATNRVIAGGAAPSRYLEKIAATGVASSSTLASHLATHLIDADMLLHDDFDGFYLRRKQVLLELIGSAMTTGHVSAESPQPATADELIAAGESQFVEFKASAFLDLKTKQAEPMRQYIIVKTVCGLLNAEGGSLFVGIEDTGGPGRAVGLEKDMAAIKANDLDRYELRLREVIENNLSTTTAATVRIQFPEVSQKAVCQIIVSPAVRPVFVTPTSTIAKNLDGKSGAQFWVRRGNATVQLQGNDMERYREDRWT